MREKQKQEMRLGTPAVLECWTDQFLAGFLSPLRHADEHRVERKAEEVPDTDGRCFRCQVSLDKL